MRKYGSVILLICLETQTLAKLGSSSLRHGYCLARIAFILDIYLWWHILWHFNHNYLESRFRQWFPFILPQRRKSVLSRNYCRFWLAAHLKVFQLSSDVNCHPILQ